MIMNTTGTTTNSMALHFERSKKQSEKNAQPADDLSRYQIHMERLPLAATGAFEVFLGWVLMLIVMTFNASLLFAAVAGSFIGFLFFGKKELRDDYGCSDTSKTDADTLSENSGTPYFFGRLILPRLIVVVFLIVLFLWIYQAEGGIGFQEATLFGWHALLMSLFVVVFTQEALLAYSSPLIGFFTKNRTTIKYYHVVCHLLGLICAVGGLVAIVYYKKLSSQPVVFPYYNVYSPHSWAGIAFLSLWSLQVLAGLNVYIVGKQSADRKRSFSKFHRFLGKSVYVVGLATCAMGFQDMQSSDLASSTPMNSTTMTMSMADMEGYFPDSSWAQYSSAGGLLLILSGMATFLAMKN
ncbi:eukaryotic cytochrome b561-domain-containing protein [Dissophora ornata]|nr:eukaryotic cytochrome b561-domain-containing protein [Dissophora ornata]